MFVLTLQPHSRFDGMKWEYSQSFEDQPDEHAIAEYLDTFEGFEFYHSESALLLLVLVASTAGDRSLRVEAEIGKPSETGKFVAALRGTVAHAARIASGRIA